MGEAKTDFLALVLCLSSLGGKRKAIVRPVEKNWTRKQPNGFEAPREYRQVVPGVLGPCRAGIHPASHRIESRTGPLPMSPKCTTFHQSGAGSCHISREFSLEWQPNFRSLILSLSLPAVLVRYNITCVRVSLAGRGLHSSAHRSFPGQISMGVPLRGSIVLCLRLPQETR